MILQEVLEFYQALIEGTDAPLNAHVRIADYIAWLRATGSRQGRVYWRKTLAGLEAPTSMGVSRGRDRRTGEIGNAEYPSRLSAASTRSLKAFAREHDLTVNTVVQGAWALLLGAYSGEDEVMYGAALAGRPPSLSDVMRIPGMFINTLPMRVAIDADLSVRRVARPTPGTTPGAPRVQYSALAHVQGWSQVPRSLRLFDVIVTFQNFPVDKTLVEKAARNGLSIELVLSQEQSTVPLTVFFTLEEEFAFALCLRPESI